MKRFIVKTLGCKVNQVESSYIRERLESAGLLPAESETTADILILNSCAVTENACKETKKILKNWAKLEQKKIILTGCAGQVFHREFEKFARDLNLKDFIILGQREKFEIEKFLYDIEKNPKTIVSNDLNSCYPLILRKFFGHSRAFVKIQDGCSSFCSYCIVPIARGRSRSLPEEHILKQISIFVEQGYEELVITGIHIGMWGEDFEKRKKLVDLLIKIEEFLSNYGKLFNIRLSSIEVNEIDEDFITFAKNSKFLCHHFHIPLQSGSNIILRKMNRKYSAEEYIEKICKLYELFPNATFGADVIVGFPTEGEQQFRETYELIEKSPLNWLHVFPYSDRPGTPAEKLYPKTNPQQIKERVHLLRELHQKKRSEFLRSQIGSIRRAVIEERKNNNWIKALTDNYIQVLINSQQIEFKNGKIIYIKLKELNEQYVISDNIKI